MSFIPENESNDKYLNDLMTVISNCKTNINLDIARELGVMYHEQDIKVYIDPQNPNAEIKPENKYITIYSCSINTVTSPEIYLAWIDLGFKDGEIVMESIMNNKYMEHINSRVRN